MSEMITLVDELSRCAVIFPPGGDLPIGGTIEVGHEIGGGGFGVVHAIDHVDGVPGARLVIKRHWANGTVTPEDNAAVLGALHRAIDSRWVSNSGRIGVDLEAIPFWVGMARWGNDRVVVSVSHDLTAAGFMPFDSVIEKPDERRSWLGLPLSDRVGAAQDLVRRHALVEELGVVHGDVNSENIFVDPLGGRATMIDWDSGTLPGAPNDRVLAWGKPDDFVAPEVKTTHGLDISLFGPETERWALGLAVHYVIFGVNPLFFLDRLTTSRIRDYLATGHQWPDIDVGSPMFNTPNRAFYSHYLQDLADLPPAAIDLFRDFVTLGALDPTRRPTARQWADALSQITAPPVVDYVRLSAVRTLDVLPVRIAWNIPGATEVHIAGRGPLPASGRDDLLLDRTQSIRVVATNPFGRLIHDTQRVEVIRTPGVPQFDLARPPSTESLTRRSPGPILPDLAHVVLSKVGRATRFPMVLTSAATSPGRLAFTRRVPRNLRSGPSIHG